MSAPIGQLTRRVNIVGITNSIACEVTTEIEHGFPDRSFVRLTGLNGARVVSPVMPHGEDPLNNERFRIIITSTTKFLLQNPITFLPIDSTLYPPYITGGSCNLIQQDYIFYPSPDQEFPN